MSKKLQMQQTAMKKQSFWSAVDQAMTSENVPKLKNTMIRNVKSIILINWWRLKTSKKLQM